MSSKKILSKNILLFLLCLILIFFIDNILTKNRMNEIQFMIDLVAQNTSERLSSAKALVELASVSGDVSNEEYKVSEKFLKKIVDNNSSMWSHFLMTDLSGIEYVHTEGAIHYGKSIADREYFITPNEENITVMAQPIHSVSTGRKIIAIGTPVFDNEQYKSVLVGFIHLQYVSELLNINSFSENSYQLMANNDGTISAHPNYEYVLSYNVKDILGEESYKNITSLKKGSSIERIDGVLSFISYAPLPNYKLSVITVMPIHEAFFNVIVIDIILISIFIAISFILLVDDKLKNTHKYAKKMAIEAYTDKLTGLKNRQWLETVEMETLYKNRFTVIFFDVDNFKSFNDRNNHSYGDNVLKFIGKSMYLCTRPDSDIVVRYAGDEFLIILRDSDTSNAVIVAKRLMNILTEYVNSDGVADIITISSGIASGIKGINTLADIVTKADNAAYLAKKNGKNTIEIAE